MEKDFITIEFKQEISVIFLWIVAGVVLVSLVFLLASQATDLWRGVNAGGVAAIIYLIALLLYVLRKPIALRAQLLVGAISLLVIGATVFTSIRMEDQTRWQAAKLMRIRAVIGRGISVVEMSRPLMSVLDAYHRQGPNKKLTLADEFRRMYEGVSVGLNIYKPQWERDGMTIVVASLEPGRIVLVAQDSYVKGRDRGFMNRDGKSGMVQEKFILTHKGLEHVSEN